MLIRHKNKYHNKYWYLLAKDIHASWFIQNAEIRTSSNISIYIYIISEFGLAKDHTVNSYFLDKNKK